MLEFFIAAGLIIMSIAGVFYYIKRQDRWIERMKGEGDDDDNGGIRH